MPRGTKKEIETFHEVDSHYQMAKEDLDARIPDWDNVDELFRSYIDESSWPYNSVVFDPRTFTSVFEKTSRLFAKKPRGRMVPRENGDALGAQINNQLLDFQWDDNERVDGIDMLAKWALMDQNARKYGASFALCKWRYEKQVKKFGDNKKPEFKSVPYFDGPDFKVLNNRDCLTNPSYSTVKNWFQHRDYLTLQELHGVNDAARSKPVYKNLDLLEQAIRDGKESKSGSDTRESNYTNKNKSIKGLQDYLGRDEYFKTIEVVTEYRTNRWITFAPKHGVVIRDIENPYDHGQIPVVMLRYYQVDDDLYGLSEIEPVESQQKAINALINQYLDSINMSLYTPLKIRASGVQMHTIEFGPGAKWIMNDPATDIIPHQAVPKGVTEFGTTYRFLVGAMQEGLGETSAATSNLDPTAPEKTATEVKDLSITRQARDNFNQIFLANAIKKQMMFWYTMNRQFMFSNPGDEKKIIQIAGKDAIRYFQKMGMDAYEVPQEAQEAISMGDLDEMFAEGQASVSDFTQPRYPVGEGEEMRPKFQMDEFGETGNLVIVPEDLSGTYDYIPDVQSMALPDDAQLTASKRMMLDLTLNPVTIQTLQQEGYKINYKALMEDFFEDLGFKDANKYFERAQNVQPEQPGGGEPQTGQARPGPVRAPRVGGSSQAMDTSQAPGVISGPVRF